MIGPVAAEEVAGFAAAVGAAGPICIEGGRTQWHVGGESMATPTLRAPQGVVDLQPAEMTVTALAGTTLAALDEQLAPHRQRVLLDGHDDATVGGVLAVGAAGVRRRGFGPPRSAVLQMSIVLADGRVATAGGPTVKNVSGFDLCRLVVGSLGTLGCIAEVILRTAPRPASSTWFDVPADVDEIEGALTRPTAHLWNGERSCVLVEGVEPHVRATARELRQLGGTEVAGPPALPAHRWSRTPSEARVLVEHTHGADVATSWVEIGVGIVHRSEPDDPHRPDATVVDLHRRLLHRFDPQRRLNPERTVVGRA